MPLKAIGTIEIPGSAGSSFDHGAFDPKTRRVFIAHTARDCVEVIDQDSDKHIATLPGFPGAAGAVADDGMVLVTNRAAASLACVDAQSLETRAVIKTGPRPNGIAIASRQALAIAACIGDQNHAPQLQVFSFDGRQYSTNVPGQPRWCVTNAEMSRVFLAIRDPSMVFVAELPEMKGLQHWKLPAGGAHGLDIDHDQGRLYVACDDRALVEVDIASAKVANQWPLAGVPDVTFFNPTTRQVHVAIG